jgi:hypothetical protein
MTELFCYCENITALFIILYVNEWVFIWNQTKVSAIVKQKSSSVSDSLRLESVDTT